MRIMFLLPFILLIGITHAAIRLSPPSNAIVVAKSGAKYSKIQDAINALSGKNATSQTIFIGSGVYNEQVYIPALKFPLTILGETEDSDDYNKNTVTITHNFSQATVTGGNDKTATLRAWSSNFKMYNVNVLNTYGKGSQAVALSAQATNQGYYGCQFRGYQDTLLANVGAQLYSKCLIEGVTDFIFGQHAAAWFEQVDIRVLSARLGYVTANGREDANDSSYYVINRSTVSASPGNSVPDGAIYLGRPWRNYARVVFQETQMSRIINPAGWREWGSEPKTEHVFFGEYGNTGDGAKGTRARFASKLSAPIEPLAVLGPSWRNATYIDVGTITR